ncbi:MAG: PepSY-like domain-containing protein [Bacteroidaceae bacterium]|nr:PepSY-like domain-containing protein [Bacteroidaceae bacterium]
MKYLMALVCLMMSAVCFADDVPIPVEQLPAAAKAFVQKTFPGKKIIYAEKDYGKYEARLDDGTEIDFDKKGNWDKVDCHMTAVPAAIIPTAIQQYVTATFPGQIITKIDKERRYGYEIELSNDIELKFNKNGMIIGMDD